MNFYVYAGLSLSIFIAGIIAAIRIRKIEGSYYPFLYVIWLGCLNESLSIGLALNEFPTLVNSNIYVLIEAILLTWFFKNMKVFKQRLIYYVVVVSLVLVWILENFVFKTITAHSTYFRIVYSFTIVFMSINLANERIFTNKTVLLKDATFIISMGFIVYFTYKALVQSFVIYGINRRSSFLLNIYIIMIYINLAVNLLYALAVLWIPKKVRFLQPYSRRSLL